MPWKVTDPVEERQKFVRRLLEGEKMSDLCVEFGISRKTGYKIHDRFMENGSAGLLDQSRRPKRLAHLLDSGLATILLRFKQEKPTWGAPKIRELFIRKHSHLKPPAISTIHVLFERHGLVTSRKRRGTSDYKAKGTYLSNPTLPNQLWCTDYKGQFRLGNQSLCYPLTITDQVSRYILAIEAMEKICEKQAIFTFRRVFEEYGLPDAIRSDNGVPFSSVGLLGLSKLSVYWLRLGIKLERIVPGNPQQNGCHERMHKSLKLGVTHPSSANLLAQQEKFDCFAEEFNQERPHEALNMKVPGQFYRKAKRRMPLIPPELQYPNHDLTAKVSRCGTLHLHNNQRIYIGVALCGENLGLKQIDSDFWQVSFMDYDLGYFDDQSNKFEPTAINPFCNSQILD